VITIENVATKEECDHMITCFPATHRRGHGRVRVNEPYFMDPNDGPSMNNGPIKKK
jgi:hypothetical protein